MDYLDPDPQVASAVVNQLVQELVDYTFETQVQGDGSGVRILK